MTRPWRTQGPVGKVTIIKGTGHGATLEPMTDAQRKYLKSLCKGTGVVFNENWSKRAAIDMIDYLKKRKASSKSKTKLAHDALTDEWIAAAERAA